MTGPARRTPPRDDAPRVLRTIPFGIVAVGIFVVQLAIVAAAALVTDLPV